jgi:hypothetical protein
VSIIETLWLRSSSILEASTGMAAFNALLEPCPGPALSADEASVAEGLVEGACPELVEGVDEAACTEVNAEDVILERGTGRRVAIVGHFPFIERVRWAAAECWVNEQMTKTQFRKGGK